MRKHISNENAVFVRDREGAARSGLSINSFGKAAESIGCVYFVGNSRLTNWDEFVDGMKMYKA